jgi:serine/threonine protein kinase
LLLQACAGVAEAHARGIVHRDLKPHNLFLARRPVGSPIVKVLDFGISKMDDGDDAHLTTTGSSLGSPRYMSIEQFRNARAVDRRSDIWALGMILHHLLTGRTAYEADNSAMYIFKISVESPVPIRMQRPDVPETIEAIILRCLEKNPDARFNTVGEFAAAIAPYATPRSQDALHRIAQYTSYTPTIAVATVMLENLLATGARPVVSASTNNNTVEGTSQDTLGSTSHWNRRSSVGLAFLLVAFLVALTGGGYFSTRHAAPQDAGQVQTSPAPVIHTAASIILRINVNPPDAIVELDGNVVKSPVEIPKGDTERELVVHADGYTTKKKTFKPSTDAYLEITLDKLPKPATPVPAFVESATSQDRKTPTKTTNTEKIKVKGPMTDSL